MTIRVMMRRSVSTTIGVILLCLVCTSAAAAQSLSPYPTAQQLQQQQQQSSQPQHCLPPSSIRLHVITQGSSRLTFPVTFSDRSQQYSFANSLIASITALNTDFTPRDPVSGNVLNQGRYPGFGQGTAGVGTIPTTYASNIEITYHEMTGKNIVTTGNDQSSSYLRWGNQQIPATQIQNGSPSLWAALDKAKSIMSAPTTLKYPHTSVVKIIVVVNDGHAWDWTAGNDVSAGTAPDGTVLSPDSPLYKQHVQLINQEYSKSRCLANDLIDSGVHIVWVHSNRSSLVGQDPIPSFASSYQKYMNVPDVQSRDGSLGTAKMNENTQLKLDFTFTQYNELLTDTIVLPVATAIREIAASNTAGTFVSGSNSGGAAKESCVAFGASGGISNLVTPDGLHYQFPAVHPGDYWMVRSLRTQDTLMVQVRYGPCARMDGETNQQSSTQCIIGAVISDGIDRVEIVTSDRTGDLRNSYWSWNGAKMAPQSFISGFYSNWGINVTYIPLGTSQAGAEVRVQFMTGHYLAIRPNLLIVKPAAHLYGRIVGLCGNFNSCPLDDMIDSCREIRSLNSSETQQPFRFAESWTVGAGESLFSTPPSIGVSAWEVSSSPTLNSQCKSPVVAGEWNQRKEFTRWPYLPPVWRDRAGGTQSSTSELTTYGVPSLGEQVKNNPALVTMMKFDYSTSLDSAVPPRCQLLRGILRASCVSDVMLGASTNLNGAYELLWSVCSTFCETGRISTHAITAADCLAAQMCSRQMNPAEMHGDYNTTAGVLPNVMFGNMNAPLPSSTQFSSSASSASLLASGSTAFFTPTLGLAGRYLIEVSEANLCAAASSSSSASSGPAAPQVLAVDVACSIPVPQIVLSFPGLPSSITSSNFADKTSDTTLTSDPLLTSYTTLTPDPLSGYTSVTVHASIFPNSLGERRQQSWKWVKFPNGNVGGSNDSSSSNDAAYVNDATRAAASFTNSTTTATTSPSPLLYGARSPRVQFTPLLPGLHVLEYAVWNGCAVSRIRAAFYVSCSIAPPVALIQPVQTDSTFSQLPFPSIFTRNGNNMAISWLGIMDAPDENYTLPSAANDTSPLQQSNIAKTSYRWSQVQLHTIDTFDSDTPKPMLKYKWNISASRKLTGNSAVDDIALLSTIQSYSPNGGTAPISPGGVFPTCDATTGYSRPAVSLLASQAKTSQAIAWPQGRRTTVYTYGLPYVTKAQPIPQPILATSQTVLSTRTQQLGMSDSALQPNQNFSASSGLPSSGVSPFTTLFNAYRHESVSVTTTVTQADVNVTQTLQQPLCRVTLTEEPSPSGTLATILLEEVGAVPAAFLPVNYCQDALYSITLTTYDDCQSSQDTVVLEPTCDGYTQAVVECDQIVYWDETKHAFPPAVIDGTQSFDWQYSVPDPESYSPTTGSQPIAQPVGRKLQYQFTNDAVTPSAQPFHSAGESRFLAAYGYDKSPFASSKQVITADVPGTYSVGLQVSNRCAVSQKATATVVFSCYGAPDCSTLISQKVDTQTPTQPLTLYSGTPVTSNWVALSNTSRYWFEPVSIVSSSSTTTGSSTSYLRHRLRVASAPTGSAYQTTADRDFPQLSLWSPAKTDAVAQIFNPDISGTYTIEVQITDSCGCDIKTQQIKISALCSTTPPDYLKIMFNTQGGYDNSNPTAPYNPSDFQTLNPYVNVPFVIGTPYTTKPRTWSVTIPNVGTPLTVTSQYFLFTPTVTGTYTIGITSSDGCQSVTNSTTLTITTPPTPPASTCTVATSKAQIVTSSGTSLSGTAVFKTSSLPKVTLAATGGGFDVGFDYSKTLVEWSITSAPVNSIYYVGSWVSNSTLTQMNQDQVWYPGYKYDTTSNSNTMLSVHRQWNTTIITTTTRSIIIPLLSQTPPISVWNGVAYGKEQFGPLNYTSDSVRAYSALHSQVCLTLDRPGMYKFKLRYMNTTDPSKCVSESEVSFTASCAASDISTPSVSITPSQPKIDGYKPLRISVGVTTDPSLTYAWTFLAAPQLNQAFNSRLSDRFMNNTNLTQISTISLTSPFSTNGQNFPPLFNLHQPSVHFLALVSGNYTLQVTVSDGCQVRSFPVVVLVDCAVSGVGQSSNSLNNRIGTIDNPIETGSQGAVSTGNAQAYVIPTSSLVVSSDGSSTTSIRPFLQTQYRLVGFTPSWSSATQRQTSAGGGGSDAQSNDPIFGSSQLNTGEVSSSSSSGLSNTNKLVVGLVVGLGGALLILLIVGGVILHKRGTFSGRGTTTVAGGPRVHDSAVTPGGGGVTEVAAAPVSQANPNANLELQPVTTTPMYSLKHTDHALASPSQT